MSSEVARLETHRVALTGHCYRMLGSPVDADDAVQETMVRAWRSLERFDGRSSLRTCMTRIATNVCIDALSARQRRAWPLEDGPRGTADDALATRERTHWLEPILDAHALPRDLDPAQHAAQKQSIRLAFVAALLHLPAKQRAVLLLAEVLGSSAAEVADTLELSVPAVTSALQRARATLAARNLEPQRASLDETETALVNRYLSAFERYDVDELNSLLRDDAVLSMPPHTLWVQGRAIIHTWLAGRGSGCRGSRLEPLEVSGLPAFAQYRPAPGGGHAAWAILVLELGGGQVASMTSFLDTEMLFPRFGLPLTLPAA